MASPFKVFRKHQKVMLAGLTILAMFSFVFLGVISDLLGTRGQQNPVAVKTSKYGKLRQSELGFMRQDRFKVFAVLAKIHAMASGMNDSQVSYRWIESIFGTTGDEDLVNTWLKTRVAEELGMTISNDTINGFLQTISGGRLSAANISEIIKQEGLTQNQFFDAVREELRALQIARLFFLSLQAFTPAERWDYFCRLRKQASVELIPLEVSGFLAQTKDPSEEELKTLFEKYKDKLPRPDSPDPGFRIPSKIDVQYVKADIAKFSEPGTISEEEILSTYEKNRDYFKQFDKEPPISLKPEGKGAAETEKTESASAAEKSQEQPKEKTSETQKPADQPKEKALDKQKPAEQPATPQDKTPKEDGKKSSAAERSPFMLTAMAEQSDKPAADKSSADKLPASKPSTEKPVAEGPKAENSAAKQSAEPEKTEKSKIILSEKVKEKVRAQVAREKVNAIFIKLQQTMDENGKKWRKYEAEKIHQKTAVAPSPLDFEALAKQYGLTAGQTGMISSWESQKLDIGSSLVEGVSPFATAAFKSMATFRPYVSIDAQGNEYLFWKINDTPELAPSLDDKDVREQVTLAWKMIQARQLAGQEAETLAESARKSNATLKEAFSGLPQIRVITPPPFTMLTEGSVPRGSSPALPRLSQVEGVPVAGMDFMRAVFNLDLNQIGTAMNASQTAVYVIQVINYNPPQDALWQIFLAEDFNKYAAAAATDVEADRRAWLESLKTSAGLQWVIKPEQRRGEPAPNSLPEED